MSWKSKSSKSHPAQNSSNAHSSSDEGSWNRKSHNPRNPKQVQQRATSPNEALWRVAKRLISTLRWLKLDLMLLAADDTHADLTDLLESSLKMLGVKLLPNLGIAPLDLDDVQLPEVMGFVSFLACLPKDDNSTASQAGNAQSRRADVGTNTGYVEGMGHAGAANKSDKKTNNALVQTSNDYMVRLTPEEVVGEWYPLTRESVRRGCFIKCVSPATTSTTSAYDFKLHEGCLAKIVNIDSDGDAQVVLLEGVDVANLYCASQRRWLFGNCFQAFEVRLPSKIAHDAASKGKPPSCVAQRYAVRRVTNTTMARANEVHRKERVFGIKCYCAGF